MRALQVSYPTNQCQSMLVIWVIGAVIAFSVYTVIKFQVNEWLNQTRMSKLSLKKTKKYSGDISEDISDAESTRTTNFKRSSKEIEVSDFYKSTDSSDSDKNEESVLEQPRPTTSMFLWPNKGSNSIVKKKTDVDSDSSVEFESESGPSGDQQVHKKSKTYHKEQFNKESETKEDVVPEVIIQYEHMISGVKVKFPVKPYSCQLAVMSKVIQGCTKSENCLLESPTGTGKTLALLCSVLAWHDHHIAQIQKEDWDKHNLESMYDKGNGHLNKMGECSNVTDKNDIEDLSFEDMMKHMKIPKIYYGTRTHKQIEQVIRELRKTAYKHKKMTILSSREYTCIQDSTRNKTELCNELLDPAKNKGCPFYSEDNKKRISNFTALEKRGMNPIWDIEELVDLGKNESACPYFAARSLMEEADVIFCPYNYIIDPDIRESMQLDLRDEVIILDEAHNIEDICRDVASVAFREDHLEAAALECEALTVQRKTDFSTYNTLKLYITKLVEFIKTISLDIIDKNSDTRSSPYWSGAELLELFNMHELGESAFQTFFAASKAAVADLNNLKEENRNPNKNQKPEQHVISTNTKFILEHLVFSMRMITSQEFVNDYRACIMENTVKDYKHTSDVAWRSSGKQVHRARTLKLICMNPGVIFAPLSQLARAIILASGTLTPIASFQSELSTKFAHILNAGHVIPKEQVFATCLAKGPNGINLRANYQNVNRWNFQDELGSLLLQVCESVPHGILCFMSSYNVMHNLMQRWQNTSLWNNIVRIKKVFIEPRYGGDLADIMREFREEIENTSAGPNGAINGALFLAVFRGKVAEGIDFKDNEARCVISVGIPYAVRKDPVIDMKFRYNDANTSKGLLSGSEWYSIQAFRALNQALGRCLRHANDWGAVILVDERFLLPEYKANLPKWVKTMWVNQTGGNFRQELRNFVARQKKNEKSI